MTLIIDLEAQYHECYSNYHATMTWYGQNSTQSRLDIRKHIRKQLKQVAMCVSMMFNLLVREKTPCTNLQRGGGGGGGEVQYLH